MGNKREMVTVTLVASYKGVLTVIEPNGEIGTYRQRGLSRMSLWEYSNLCGAGILEPGLENVPGLPSNYRLVSDTGIRMTRYETLPRMSLRRA